MPLYEYRCPSCERRFEVLQRMGAGGENVACPDCGTGRPVRQLSTFAAATAGGGGEAAGTAAAATCCRAASGFS